MTSKNSFHDLLKEDRKRRLWSIALSILANFFALPVFAALCMSIYEQRLIEELTNLADVREAFLNTVAGGGNIPVLLAAGALALINGLNGMAYLHSRTKTDLYFGLPVKREVIFNSAFLNGIFFFAIPYVIMMAVTAVFGYARSYFVLSSIPTVLFGMLYVLVMYIAMYTIVVLAALICGNTVVSIFMSVIMMFYVPLCYLTLTGYCSMFLTNYYHKDDHAWRFLSPAMAYIWFCLQKADNYYSQPKVDLISAAVSVMVVMAVFTVLVYLLSVLLVRKRPAEAATKAVAFRGLKPVIKILLMIVGTMLFALLMAEVSSGERFGWIIFGYVVGILLIQAVCEIVYEFDFKACLKHPVSFIFGAAVTAGIMTVLLFDLCGYDSYIPDRSSIKSTAVCCYNLETGIEYTDDETGYYITTDDHRLDHMFLDNKNTDDVIKLAEDGVRFAKRVHQNQLRYINEGGNGTPESEQFEERDYANFVIAFRLNNGHTVYRNYYVDLTQEEQMKALGNIMETKEYKEGVYDDLLDIDKKEMSQMHVTSGIGYRNLKLDDAGKEEFLDYYRMDLMDQDFDSMKNEMPCCVVVATDTEKKEWMYEGREKRFYIYPSYERCMRFLADRDILPGVDVSKITSLSVSRYMEDGWFNADFDDREKIEEIISLCVPSSSYYFDSALHVDRDDEITSLDVNVQCDDSDYASYVDSFVFATDDIPDYVTGSMTRMD
ncbi:MAG: hypothetical protein IK139_02315 [Lachnospiraceae bacterium]|nr:hypothetical protein [Lachnospiraceae bacterium]